MICWWRKTSGEEKKPGAVSMSLGQRTDGNNIIFQLTGAKVSRRSQVATAVLSVMEIVRCAENCTFKRCLSHEPVIKPKPNQTKRRELRLDAYLVVVPRRADVAAGVRRPGDPVDACAVVVEPCHGGAGHADVQDDHLAGVHRHCGQVVGVLRGAKVGVKSHNVANYDGKVANSSFRKS